LSVLKAVMCSPRKTAKPTDASVAEIQPVGYGAEQVEVAEKA
jgi:hypothetical protein